MTCQCKFLYNRHGMPDNGQKKKGIDHKILKKFSFTCIYQKFYVILERNSEIA